MVIDLYNTFINVFGNEEDIKTIRKICAKFPCVCESLFEDSIEITSDWQNLYFIIYNITVIFSDTEITLK